MPLTMFCYGSQGTGLKQEPVLICLSDAEPIADNISPFILTLFPDIDVLFQDNTSVHTDLGNTINCMYFHPTDTPRY